MGDQDQDADGVRPSDPWWPSSGLARVLVVLGVVGCLLLLSSLARGGDWLAVFVIPAGAVIGVFTGRYLKRRGPYS